MVILVGVMSKHGSGNIVAYLSSLTMQFGQLLVCHWFL